MEVINFKYSKFKDIDNNPPIHEKIEVIYNVKDVVKEDAKEIKEFKVDITIVINLYFERCY